MILGQADGHYKSLALKGCSPGEVSRSSDDEEAAFVRSLRGQEKSTNHARRHSRLPDPRKRAWCSSSAHALSHSALDRGCGGYPSLLARPRLPVADCV